MRRPFVTRDYKEFVRQRLAVARRGHWSKLAMALQVDNSVISRVFKGDRHLTPEQAHKVARFLELDHLETEFFVEAVLYARAGSEGLRDLHASRLAILEERSFALVSGGLTGAAPSVATYFSAWYYQAIALLSTIRRYDVPERIARALRLSDSTVHRVMSFLREVDVFREEAGCLRPREEFRHPVGELAAKHHVAWRLRGIESLNGLAPASANFTCPMAVSRVDAKRIRILMRQALAEALDIVDKSEPETLICINLDMFDIVEDDTLEGEPLPC